MKNRALLEGLKKRGLSIRALAKAIGSSRAHVSLVLNNAPGRGGQTRRKLAKLMTEEERGLAGWNLPVPCGTGSERTKGKIMKIDPRTLRLPEPQGYRNITQKPELTQPLSPNTTEVQRVMESLNTTTEALREQVVHTCHALSPVMLPARERPEPEEKRTQVYEAPLAAQLEDIRVRLVMALNAVCEINERLQV